MTAEEDMDSAELELNHSLLHMDKPAAYRKYSDFMIDIIRPMLLRIKPALQLEDPETTLAAILGLVETESDRDMRLVADEFRKFNAMILAMYLNGELE